MIQLLLFLQLIAPPQLSGNFAEIRSNHFHSGVDIRTDDKIGKPIEAFADGYVSRISVSPTGFGRALYITHPDGKMSVYAHLESFRDDIQQYITQTQYNRKSYAVEIYPSRWRFAIKKSEIIALSGNSGSSDGAHIHFEVRENGDPVNPITRQFFTGVKDSIPPQIRALYHIEVDTIKGVPIHTVRGIYTKIPEIITIGAPSYFAIETIDRKDNVPNTFGIYSFNEQLDENTIFSYALNKINFATTRFINTLLLYGASKAARYDVIRAYVSPNNPLKFYKTLENRGVITLKDSINHNVSIKIADDFGNTAAIAFKIKKGARAHLSADGIPVIWDHDFTYKTDSVTVGIPQNALYESELFTIQKMERPVIGLSSRYIVHKESIPLQKAIELSIRPDTIPNSKEDKLCLVSITQRGTIIYHGGAFNGGKVKANVRSFGEYFVSIDTIPPEIEDITKNNTNSLEFKVSDDLSGIVKWNMEIDGRWALSEYDPKNNKIVHHFKHARYEKNRKHTLKLEVIDNKNNKSIVEKSFIY